MLLWLMIALLLVLTLTAILAPLFRGRGTIVSRAVFDVNIYKDQLKAIDRELEEGQIDKEDAEAARIEISRKLLAAADKSEKNPVLTASGRELSRYSAMALAVVVPALAIGIYVMVGRPALPDQPLEARLKTPSIDKRIAELIARAEKRLAERPDDGRGWDIMAPVYLRHQMYAKARTAFENAIRLQGPSAGRLSGLADAIILGNNGIVGDEVPAILRQAISLDPDFPKPHFWLGMYHEQKQEYKKAGEIYTNLLQKSDAKVGWRPLVEKRLNKIRQKQGLPPVTIAGVKNRPAPDIRLGDALKAKENATGDSRKAAARPAESRQGGAGNGPSAAEVEAAARMSPADRQKMINDMVSRLSERLYSKGGDIESWIRLVTVYNIMGKKADARKALAAGKKNLGKDRQGVARLDALEKQLGLGS